jgi:hypothetical protein
MYLHSQLRTSSGNFGSRHRSRRELNLNPFPKVTCYRIVSTLSTTQVTNSTGQKLAFLANAFSLSSTFLNLVFFLLTLCKPLEPPIHNHTNHAGRHYGTTHQPLKNSGFEKKKIPQSKLETSFKIKLNFE